MEELVLIGYSRETKPSVKTAVETDEDGSAIIIDMQEM
jgi:hypothetical protein